MAKTAAEVNELKKAPHAEGVLPLFLHRWSARAFAEKPVSHADLKAIFEAVRWSASSNNRQPWRFLLGLHGDDTFRKLSSTLMSANALWAPNAAALVLGVTQTEFDGKPNPAALYDLGAASAHLTLQATALGLTTHSMAGYDREAARAAFDIPENFQLGVIIAIGYQGEPATLSNDQLIEREITPRERKPLSEIVYSTWDVSSKL